MSFFLALRGTDKDQIAICPDNELWNRFSCLHRQLGDGDDRDGEPVDRTFLNAKTAAGRLHIFAGLDHPPADGVPSALGRALTVDVRHGRPPDQRHPAVRNDGPGQAVAGVKESGLELHSATVKKNNHYHSSCLIG